MWYGYRSPDKDLHSQFYHFLPPVPVIITYMCIYTYEYIFVFI